jgi:hypothetical protein
MGREDSKGRGVAYIGVVQQIGNGAIAEELESGRSFSDGRALVKVRKDTSQKGTPTKKPGSGQRGNGRARRVYAASDGTKRVT